MVTVLPRIQRKSTAAQEPDGGELPRAGAGGSGGSGRLRHAVSTDSAGVPGAGGPSADQLRSGRRGEPAAAAAAAAEESDEDADAMSEACPRLRFVWSQGFCWAQTTLQLYHCAEIRWHLHSCSDHEKRRQLQKPPMHRAGAVSALMAQPSLTDGNSEIALDAATASAGGGCGAAATPAGRAARPVPRRHLLRRTAPLHRGGRHPAHAARARSLR